MGDWEEDASGEAEVSPMTEKEYTLVFCRRENSERREILLGFKKRGFGAGKWNGFGGKLEDGESNEIAANRLMTLTLALNIEITHCVLENYRKNAL
jgi:8-oxo-dGTP diphosphatase / 2-hydroxy-dATP diphosphatase